LGDGDLMHSAEVRLYLTDGFSSGMTAVGDRCEQRSGYGATARFASAG